MKPITWLYILNASLILLHEIESAYWREWEILKLPGQVSGFILLHFPLLLLIMYGLIEIEKQSSSGIILGIATGTGGLLPLLIHRLLFRKADKFNLVISNILLYLNFITGIILIVLLVPLLGSAY
jgi:hypothetical protein